MSKIVSHRADFRSAASPASRYGLGRRAAPVGLIRMVRRRQPLVWACAALVAADLALPACGDGATVAEVDGITIRGGHWTTWCRSWRRRIGVTPSVARLWSCRLRSQLSQPRGRTRKRVRWASWLAIERRGTSSSFFKYEQIEGLHHELFVHDPDARKIPARLPGRIPGPAAGDESPSVLESRIELERISRAEREVTPTQIVAFYGSTNRSSP
jgi:hypothetical protein